MAKTPLVMTKKLISEMGGAFSAELGIDLKGGPSRERLFKWFLASRLFGARISSGAAMSAGASAWRRKKDVKVCFLS